MHGYSSGSGLLVNAEVDSMGGVVDGGVGVGLKTSPRRAAIERAQAVLRQEYDVREERRRELEFLEKGGNPLDFKFGNVASVSVQSTSLTDQHPEQIVTSEAKGSFALAASPHGDSVESSGRPSVPAVCEPNSADNLLLFDGENELLEAERSSIQPSRRNNIAPSEQSSQMDGSQNAKESEDSAIVRPYARRNRSRHPIRDGARGRDGKGMVSETNNTKDQNIPSVSNPKSASSNGDMVSKIVSSDNQLDTDLDGVQALGTTGRSLPEGKLDIKAPKSLRDNQHDQPSQVGSQQTAIDMASGVPDLVGERHQVVSAGVEHLPCATTTKDENETRSGQLNGFSSIKIDRKSILNEGQNSNAALGTKGLDPECSSTQASLGLDVNNDSDMCTNTRKVVSNGNTMEQTSNFEETINLAGGEVVKEKNDSNGGVDKKNDTKVIDKTNETKAVDSGPIIDAHHDSVYQNHSGNVSVVEVEEDMHINRSELQNEVKYSSNIEGVQQNEHTASETEGKVDDVLGDNSNPGKENIGTGGLQEHMDISNRELPGAALSGMDSSAAPEPQTCSGNGLKLADKAHEDSILEEARTIEAKRKRIAELSDRTLCSEHRRKSQWDFVIEEMAWLANDFAQERLWKINAAAQVCHRAAFTSRLRFEQQNQFWEQKRVARTFAKAVMQFWCSAEVLLDRDDPSVGQKNCKYSLVGSRSDDGNEVSKDKIGESDMERSQELGTQYPRKNPAIAVLGYAVRFLKYNSSVGPSLQAEAPSTPDRISDLGTVEMSWEDHLTEESLFYSVPPGAMETYRKSIEYHLLQSEKTGSSMQEEVDTSTYDAVADYGYEENVYDEDEGETSTFSLPGAFEGSKSSKFAQKKRKSLMKSYNSRSYDVGADMPYGHYTTGTQQSMLMGKRPANLNVGSIPTKRMRTATRQRVLSPFSTGATGNMQAQVKTDASSGDTNSCQDDQSTLHGGSQIQKSVEVESVGDFEKQLPYDCAETSIKLKKKKKAKHLGSTYDLGWQMDSSVLNEQRDHSKKRMEGHHFESNGTSGLYGQPNAKKPKIMKQSLDNTFDNITPMSGSIPSPVASQMSNMSNPNKFIKLIGGRDRGRKVKALKMSPGQSGSGSPWSLFEDQALVVLVHDMGPNWELVSDVINSTLQFKCIFRKPKECKERHKLLMDRNAGDGADSAEDSGSSQSYTLPGIPKGSARQLFQRLQGPMEEDTIKAHFEKIIMIGQKQHYRRSQSDNQDLKQIGAIHNSHAVAISQVCANNLNGGVLTPLDICDATTSSPDHPLGYQGSHATGLAISNQGAVASVLPTSGANSALQGSSGVVLGGNLSSPSGPPNASVRDGRYNVPRTSSLPVDEQQRLQQYNQMLSGRSIQQSSMSVPGALSAADRGVRMLPGGNGMGMMCGMNRSMPISRPGFQGMPSSSMLNSGTMHSSSMVGIPSPVNIHSGPGSGQVNSMLRPRDTMHMMRPGHNPEHQRQMMVPELQMQVTQGNSQVMPHFNGLSSAFSNQTTSPPVQPYSGHSQQQHQMAPQQSQALSGAHHPHIQGSGHPTGSQQQAYAIRLAKERHLHQRYLQQQQQPPFAASNALMPHVQPQPQLPISSSLQNSSQIQSQTSSQPVSLSPVTASSPMTPLSSQHQQKHQLPQHGLSRNPGAGGLTNQMGKQRQRQPQQQQFQQSGRHHPQQRPQAQSQQQAKLMKGIGRGNMLVQQNLPIDPSHLNGLSIPPGSQAPEKGEQIMHAMQGQGYSGSGLNPVQPSKPLVPSQSSNHSQLQQKLLSGPAPPSLKQLQQMPPHSDNSTQGQSPPVPSGHTLSSSHQTIPSANIASNHHQLQLQPQQQPHQKQVNQTQSSVQRMLQQNRQVNSELQNKSQTDLAQADQQALNNASQVICSTAMPQACIDSADVAPVVSSGTASQWKAEPAYDSNLPDLVTQVSSVGSPPIPNSAGSEPLPPISPGLGPRQLSGSFPSHGHNVGAQWQPQLPPQQSPTPPPPSQQQYQAQEQQSPQQIQPQQQSHQQTQLLQAGQGSLYMRPTSSKLE